MRSSAALTTAFSSLLGTRDVKSRRKKEKRGGDRERGHKTDLEMDLHLEENTVGLQSRKPKSTKQMLIREPHRVRHDFPELSAPPCVVFFGNVLFFMISSTGLLLGAAGAYNLW